MSIIEKKHLITEYPCFEARNTSVKPAKKGFKHHTHFYFVKTLHTRSTSYGNGLRKVFTERHAAIIFEGWVLNSLQWSSCTNPEGKLTTPMSKRDVAVRILSL